LNEDGGRELNDQRRAGGMSSPRPHPSCQASKKDTLSTSLFGPFPPGAREYALDLFRGKPYATVHRFDVPPSFLDLEEAAPGRDGTGEVFHDHGGATPLVKDQGEPGTAFGERGEQREEGNLSLPLLG
jgi:hypothetical protein